MRRFLPKEDGGKEGFMVSFNQAFERTTPVGLVVVGNEGKAFQQPTLQEAEEFVSKNMFGLSIQHCKLNVHALNIVRNSKASIIILNNVQANEVALANALANTTARILTLQDDPTKLKKLLQALQKLDINPILQLEPPINAGFHCIGRFMTNSKVTRLRLTIKRGNGIFARKSLKLVSTLKKLRDLTYRGDFSIADFYWLSTDERRNDDFSGVINEDIVLFPKNVSMEVNAWLHFKDDISAVLLRNLLMLHERRSKSAEESKWKRIQDTLSGSIKSVAFTD